MTSTAHDDRRRRSRTLRHLVDRLERSGFAHLPPVPDGFADEADLLVALHGLWSRRLATRVDTALELGDGGLEACVEAAWRDVARQLPVVRRVLDRHEDHPALVRSRQHEHRLLALAAGRASAADPLSVSAARGEDFVEAFRAGDRAASSSTGWRRWVGLVLSPA